MFNSPQEWVMNRKTRGKPCRCSGCLSPGIIRVNDLNLGVKGLMYSAKTDKVFETTLRFCIQRRCVQNITSRYHNIKPLRVLEVQKDANVTLEVSEIAHFTSEGFSIRQ